MPIVYKNSIIPTETTKGGETSEEYWYSLRRCIKCKAFYTEAQNQEPGYSCCYHPGVYTSPQNISDLAVGWSCCRSGRDWGEEFEYLQEKSKGCRKNASHTEDHVFTNTMKQFPFDVNGNKDEQLKQVLTDESIKQETQPRSPAAIPGLEELTNHPDFITHRVTKVDTLAGLAIKYKTNTSTIKRVNRLPNELVFQRDLIFIPKKPGCKEPIPSVEGLSNGNKISLFVTKTDCGAEEGKFYLEEASWDIEQALTSWQEDVSWSKKN